MKLRFVVGATLLLVRAPVAAARADGICVTVDEAKDRLAAEDRAAARQVFENTLVAAGAPIGPPCAETWTVAHVELGGAVQILVTTPRGAFTASASSLADVGDAYAGIVWRALATTQAAPSTSPAGPTEPEVMPVPVKEDDDERLRGVFYVRVGYGVGPGVGSDTASRYGPTIGVGYRRWMDRWLFDLSVMNLHAWRESNEFDSSYDMTFLSFGRLTAYRLVPRGANAFYFGGGLSFGESEVRIPQDGYVATDNAYGVQVEGAAGYEILRDKRVRVFFEAWVTLPLTRTETSLYDPTTMQTEQNRYWAPFLGLSTGLGF